MSKLNELTTGKEVNEDLPDDLWFGQKYKEEERGTLEIRGWKVLMIVDVAGHLAVWVSNEDGMHRKINLYATDRTRREEA